MVPPASPPSSRRPARKAPASKAPAPLPTAVAIRLPPLPAYHSAKMELRAEIDHGEVIRTHGTAAYRSVKRGESNGCHRMHNYVVLRLAGFLVKHPQRLGISVVCGARAKGSEVPTPSGMA